MNRPVKFSLYLVSFIICVVGIYIGALVAFCETVFWANPEIDTQVTVDFSKEKFGSLSPGMSTSQVEALLGTPFTTQGGTIGCWDGEYIDLPSTPDNLSLPITVEIELPPEGTEVWSYSKRGTFKWFKFAWLEYRVQFGNSKLQKTERCWHAV